MKASEALGYDDLPALVGRLTGDERHESSSSSTLDVLWVLYDQVLNVSPDTADSPDRDRFLLSKGHGPMAYYSVLAAKGFIEPELLDGWARFDSPLGHEPDRVLVPGVEMSAGSLGHGLPLGVGTVLGLRAQERRQPRVVVLVGDGELDEGSNHEAIALAGRLGLEQLTAVVIDNSTATHGWPGGIDRRFAVEGWEALTVDGCDHTALRGALTAAHPNRPLAVVARIASNTAEGKQA
ncbi:thiamine pyrophosphate-dependent enzyme [Streptomyces cylindrosporus]|uniref:Thiamine pyrophosphate-dependent enzyme n=1 Tax=Streptomyces cylindrosporus TaxID=2927583 RepID=A0ABS9Y8E2_9ACTN|nr:thiamine pyrophosphate-dependent enzyme [Streptomyces cylindrosporus]MCI3273495.1 thiamine pyrophosphate-dependent enzyme [Streptomyces cylindrosporus]